MIIRGATPPRGKLISSNYRANGGAAGRRRGGGDLLSTTETPCPDVWLQNPPLDLALQMGRTGTARPLNGVNQPRLASAGPPGASVWAQAKDHSPESRDKHAGLEGAERRRQARACSDTPPSLLSPTQAGPFTLRKLTSPDLRTEEPPDRADFVLSCFEAKMKESGASFISGFEGLRR